MCEIFHFWFCFVFIKFYIFAHQKAFTLWLWSAIIPFQIKIKNNSFPNQNDRKSTHAFANRPPIFKFKQEVLKFNRICVSWSLPKTDLEMKFSKLENGTLKGSFFHNRNYLSLSHRIKNFEKNTTNSTDRKMSIFRDILVSIFSHSNWLRKGTLYLSVFSPNEGKYGPE